MNVEEKIIIEILREFSIKETHMKEKFNMNIEQVEEK